MRFPERARREAHAVLVPGERQLGYEGAFTCPADNDRDNVEPKIALGYVAKATRAPRERAGEPVE